jgi:hypothetical protein
VRHLANSFFTENRARRRTWSRSVLVLAAEAESTCIGALSDFRYESIRPARPKEGIASVRLEPDPFASGEDGFRGVAGIRGRPSASASHKLLAFRSVAPASFHILMETHHRTQRTPSPVGSGRAKPAPGEGARACDDNNLICPPGTFVPTSPLRGEVKKIMWPFIGGWNRCPAQPRTSVDRQKGVPPKRRRAVFEARLPRATIPPTDECQGRAARAAEKTVVSGVSALAKPAFRTIFGRAGTRQWPVQGTAGSASATAL